MGKGQETFDTFDIEAQEAARAREAEKAKLREKIEGEDFTRVMANKSGRRFVHNLLDRAGVFRLSFSTNALQMAFNEGNRNEGLRLVAKAMEHCPDLYTQMLKEHREDE